MAYRNAPQCMTNESTAKLPICRNLSSRLDHETRRQEGGRTETV